MTDQHRATPEQWADQERYSRAGTPFAVCLLELRARVEALEKAQRKAAMDELHAASAECQPLAAGTSVLVHRVLDAMDDKIKVNRYEEARAAIREVAAWLAAGPLDYTASPDYFAAMLLDEANR